MGPCRVSPDPLKGGVLSGAEADLGGRRQDEPDAGPQGTNHGKPHPEFTWPMISELFRRLAVHIHRV